MHQNTLTTCLAFLSLGGLALACSSSDDDARALSGGERTSTDLASDGDWGPSASGGADSLIDPTDPVDPSLGAGGEANVEDEVPARVAPPKKKPVPAGQLTAGIFDDNQSFEFFKTYQKLMMVTQNKSAFPQFSLEDHESAFASYASAQVARQDLDISLVIDTTGSMGDELGYLQQEFSKLTTSIGDLFPQASQKWSLVVYRDHGDEYLTESTPFTSDLDSFRSVLAAQKFDGGGDTPEAPDEGLAAANQLNWRSGDDVARLAFWVADAPHHDENASAMKKAIESAQGQDIHIYPVASSGVDEFTETTMRLTAQLTHGRYIFLTDDSGLGGEHKEPTVPCSYITTLSDAILRAVSTEMTGDHNPPDEDSVLRLQGSLNEDGACFYGKGNEAYPF